MVLTLSQQVVGEEFPWPNEARKNYAELIPLLVSPNEKPSTAGESVTFSDSYDVKAQLRIHAIRQILHDNVEDALPSLVEALDEERYCMTVDWAEGDVYINCSVGDICRNVIATQLEVYRDKMRFSDPQHWHRYDYPISKKWWKSHKGSNLAELQTEAIKWAIDRRKAEPEEHTDEDSKDEISDLQKLRAAIAESGRPAKSRRMLRMITSNK